MDLSAVLKLPNGGIDAKARKKPRKDASHGGFGAPAFFLPETPGKFLNPNMAVTHVVFKHGIGNPKMGCLIGK